MKRKAGMICMILGAVLIGAALSLFLYNEWDSARAEERRTGTGTDAEANRR